MFSLQLRQRLIYSRRGKKEINKDSSLSPLCAGRRFLPVNHGFVFLGSAANLPYSLPSPACFPAVMHLFFLEDPLSLFDPNTLILGPNSLSQFSRERKRSYICPCGLVLPPTQLTSSSYRCAKTFVHSFFLSLHHHKKRTKSIPKRERERERYVVRSWQ